MGNDVVKFAANGVEFAEFGKNALAYVRRVKSEELNAAFPQIEELPVGLDLWGLFGADGEPIAVSDAEKMVRADAFNRELLPLSRH